MKQITNATSNTSVTFAPTTNPTSRTMVIGGVQDIPVQDNVSESAPEPDVGRNYRKRNALSSPFSNSLDLAKHLRGRNILASKDWAIRNFDVSLSTKGNSVLSPHVIDQIIRMANFWKPYISDESYEKLVLYIVETFTTIHTCAIGSYPALENSYILNIDNIVNIKPLPRDVMTFIKLNGKTYISEGKSAPLIALR